MRDPLCRRIDGMQFRSVAVARSLSVRGAPKTGPIQHQATLALAVRTSVRLGRPMARRRLSHAHCKRIEGLLPPARSGRGRRGRPPVDRRKVLDGILWILRTGAPWRDLPDEFGAWQTCWRLFDRWNTDGVLVRILQSLQAEAHRAGRLDTELWCIDGTVVRASRAAAGGGKKGIRRSLTITH